MANNDFYSTAAKKIAKELNDQKLAFKTYQIDDLNTMVSEVAKGGGSRINTAKTSEQFSHMLLELGFTVYPPITESTDSYIRIYRSASLMGNLLHAIKYPGPGGDEYLSNLLTTIKKGTII